LDPYLDIRVHPEGLGIVMDKKLLNTPCGILYPEFLGSFFSTHIGLTLLDPYLDSRVHPKGLGIVMDKKLLNTSY